MPLKLKKVLKTKAERLAERKAKELEQQRLAALEQQRLAELAELKKQDAVRLQNHLNEKRKLEISNLITEIGFLKSLAATRAVECNLEIEQFNKESEWNLIKDGKDISISHNELKMNTFLSMTKDIDHSRASEAFIQINNIVQISRDVSATLCDISENSPKWNFLITYLTELTNMIKHKIEVIAASSMRFADKLINDDQIVSVEREDSSGAVSIGLWACYKELRLKDQDVTWDKLGCHLRIPYILFTHYLPYTTGIKLLKMETNDNFRQKNDVFILGDTYVLDIVRCPRLAVRSSQSSLSIVRDFSFGDKFLPKLAFPSETNDPIYLTLYLNCEVVVTPEAHLARWDPVKNLWSRDGISEFVYVEDRHCIQANLHCTGAFALIKPTHADLPLRGWSLKPSATDVHDSACQSCELNVSTKYHDFSIQVHGHLCQLRSSLPALRNLTQQKYSAGQLLFLLRRHGINLEFTNVDMERHFSCKNKDKNLEECTLLGIARCCASNTICFSYDISWNQSLPANQLGLAWSLLENSLLTENLSTDAQFVRKDDAAEADVRNQQTASQSCEVRSLDQLKGIHYVLGEIDSMSESQRLSPDVTIESVCSDWKGPDLVKFTAVVGEVVTVEEVQETALCSQFKMEEPCNMYQPTQDYLVSESELETPHRACQSSEQTCVESEAEIRTPIPPHTTTVKKEVVTYSQDKVTDQISHADVTIAVVDRVGDDNVKLRIEKSNEWFTQTLFTLLRALRSFSTCQVEPMERYAVVTSETALMIAEENEDVVRDNGVNTVDACFDQPTIDP